VKDYPYPCELALFCYKLAKSRGWCLDKSLQLLVWNSVKSHWSKTRTMKAALLLMGAWSYGAQISKVKYGAQEKE